MTTPHEAKLTRDIGDSTTMLHGGAVAETAIMFANTTAKETADLERTSTQPLKGNADTAWETTQGSAPSRDRVLAAVSLQAWYRAAKARSALLSEKIPGGKSSSLSHPFGGTASTARQLLISLTLDRVLGQQPSERSSSDIDVCAKHLIALEKLAHNPYPHCCPRCRKCVRVHLGRPASLISSRLMTCRGNT